MKHLPFNATNDSAMTDPFTTLRISKLLDDFRHRYGRDIAMGELNANGFSTTVVDDLVRNGLLTKYQVVAKGGRRENRFKLATDWRSLKK
jgi:hypothetical protein